MSIITPSSESVESSDSPESARALALVPLLPESPALAPAAPLPPFPLLEFETPGSASPTQAPARSPARAPDQIWQPRATPMPVALLIDAETISAAHAPAIIERIVASIGNPIVRRAYGNWRTPLLSDWKRLMEVNGILPVQQHGARGGRSGADATLIMDAMDLLYGRLDGAPYDTRIGGFCIVSSDCNFTGLAMRIRERGRLVVGFGRRQTMQVFVAACDDFVFLDGQPA